VTQTVANITTTLKAAGLGPADVVATQGYATRADEAKSVADALKAAGAASDRPSGLVVLPRLPGPIRAELTFVAAWPNQSRERLAGAPRVLRAGNTAYVGAEPARAPADTVEAELAAAFTELRTLLRGVRLDTRDVALLTVYLSDLADLPRVNAVFKDTFPNDPPARVTIQVQPQGGERVRIGAIAAM
jgi:enamine deaminase RidA (YjgF/YER057c/UK114 family)